MSIAFTNEYEGLSQDSIDHNASSIINAVCGDSSLLIGDVVKLLSTGSGEGFTQADDLLPRIGIITDPRESPYGVVVGGDLEGIYSDDVDITDGLLVSFFGGGVRVCTQGRCVARIFPENNSINVGDKLTINSSNASLQLASDNFPVIARALQSVAQNSSADDVTFAAVDFQREEAGDVGFKKELTVLAADVTGASPLVDFPLLVSIVDTDLRDNARSDGFDIFFTESDGTTVIPYDRESYDSTTGTLSAWVLTTLSDTTDNTFFMFYGNLNTTTDQQDALAVWDTRFEDIFHFNQTSPLPWVNSSEGKNFTILANDASPSPVTGQIDTASDSNAEEDDSTSILFRMVSDVDVSPTAFFVSAWVKYDVIPTTGGVAYDSWNSNQIRASGEAQIIMGSGQEAGSSENEIIEVVIFEDGGVTEFVIGDMADLAYHHVAIRYLSGSFDLFFDGVITASSPISFTFTDTLIFDSTQCGGGVLSVGNPQSGRIDQLQVAYTGSFSNGFVTTSFDNQKTAGQGAGNFVKVGSQEII